MSQGTPNRQRFVHSLGLNTPVVFAEQVHGYTIGMADNTSANPVRGVDGLISRQVPVAVMMADCVPVLLVDPVHRVCSAVHAGWKGTLDNIARRAVDLMENVGAQLDEIYCVIGPHIGGCCYDVTEERSKLFQDRYGRDEKMAYRADGKWHLDVGWMNYRHLIESGISVEHIDASPICTSCQHHDYFSFRKDAQEESGKMMAVIGFGTI